jgi:hypothetical protein
MFQLVYHICIYLNNMKGCVSTNEFVWQCHSNKFFYINCENWDLVAK